MQMSGASVVFVFACAASSATGASLRTSAFEASIGGATTRSVSPRIPPQLVMTAKESNYNLLANEQIRNNIDRTLNRSSGLSLRWLGDVQCLQYIREHYDEELADFYAKETVGMFRGDICRAAVLGKEGGFYLDLDVEPNVQLHTLVGKDTTFMSAFTAAKHLVLNAMMASAPANPIMLESIEQMRAHYRGETTVVDNVMGPTVLFRAFRKVTQEQCGKNMTKASLSFKCGSEDIRMFQESRYQCDEGAETPDCPAGRTKAMAGFKGAQYAIYGPKRLVAWSRFVECQDFGCGGEGHGESELGK